MKKFIFIAILALAGLTACQRTEMTPPVKTLPGTEPKAVGVTYVAWYKMMEATNPNISWHAYNFTDQQMDIWNQPLMTWLEDDNNVPSYQDAEDNITARFDFIYQAPSVEEMAVPVDSVIHLYYKRNTPDSVHFELHPGGELIQNGIEVWPIPEFPNGGMQSEKTNPIK